MRDLRFFAGPYPTDKGDQPPRGSAAGGSPLRFGVVLTADAHGRRRPGMGCGKAGQRGVGVGVRAWAHGERSRRGAVLPGGGGSGGWGTRNQANRTPRASPRARWALPPQPQDPIGTACTRGYRARRMSVEGALSGLVVLGSSSGGRRGHSRLLCPASVRSTASGSFGVMLGRAGWPRSMARATFFLARRARFHQCRKSPYPQIRHLRTLFTPVRGIRSPMARTARSRVRGPGGPGSARAPAEPGWR